jgi:hypothetical protein
MSTVLALMAANPRFWTGRQGQQGRLVPCEQMFSIAHNLPRTLSAAVLAGVAAARAHEGDFSCAGFDPESPRRWRPARLPLQQHLNL